MVWALVALGSNTGPRRAYLDAGLSRLRALPQTRVVNRSEWVRSEPEQPGDGPYYLNGGALLNTSLEARTLLQALLKVERELGRVRRARERSRTLDLDLILFGGLRSLHPRLRVPHPRYRQRPFVLEPALTLGANLWDIELGRPLAHASGRKNRSRHATR